MKRPILLAAALSVAALASGLVLMTASSVAASSLPTLTLAVTKSSVTVGGSEVSGAVNIATTVTGEKSDVPALFLLKPGVTPAEFNKLAGALGSNSPLDAIDPYASIVFNEQAPEGTSSAETWLQPGTYIAANSGSGEAVFTVTASATPALLPAPAATVTTVDFAFRGADTLHDGELVRFTNDGYLIHMFAYVPVASVADATKVEALLLAGNPNAAKKYAVGKLGLFAGPLSHAELQQEAITEPPGVYVILCLMNAEDGREHFQLGMFRTITIVK
jgi:hypothetical protein